MRGRGYSGSDIFINFIKNIGDIRCVGTPKMSKYGETSKVINEEHQLKHYLYYEEDDHLTLLELSNNLTTGLAEDYACSGFNTLYSFSSIYKKRTITELCRKTTRRTNSSHYSDKRKRQIVERKVIKGG